MYSFIKRSFLDVCSVHPYTSSLATGFLGISAGGVGGWWGWCGWGAVRTTNSRIQKKATDLGGLPHRGPGSAALGHPWPPRHLHILCFIVPPSAVRTTNSRIQKKATQMGGLFLYWWSQAGSNRRPQHCQCCALPAELWPRISEARILVGTPRVSQARIAESRHIPSRVA